jgi:hypothetical protein
MLTETRLWRPNPKLRLRRGINLSNLDVGADAGSFIFTVKSVVTMLIGLPILIPFHPAAQAPAVAAPRIG